MTTFLNHSINHRLFTTLHPVEKELILAPEKNYLFDLSYLGIIDVIGDKSTDFLQGQLTCDVNAISDIQMLQGAQCNLQGRILTLMDVLQWNGIKLVLPKDLILATINSFNKTAMLSRVSLKENEALRVFGFYLQNPNDLTPDTTFFPTILYGLTYGDDYCVYHLGSGFYIVITGTHFGDKISQMFSTNQQLLGSLTWHTLRLAKQELSVYPDSRGLFLPHRLNLHQTPYLSFNKGCYKGQEIIARMHYKGTLKHHLMLYSLSTTEQIFCGQKILNAPGGSEIGELIDYSMLGSNSYLVAVSILKNTDSDVLFEGHNEFIKLRS